MVRAFAAIALLLGAAACGSQPPVEAQPPQPPAAPSVALVSDPDAGSGAPRSNQTPAGVINAALRAVSEVRMLRAKRSVSGKVISRSEMVAHIRQELRDEVPPDVVAAQNELLYSLHVVPADFDFEDSLLSLMQSEIAGFYNPKDKTMYLSSDLEGPERDATLWHELVHALQDQHYDLRGKLKQRDDASDELSALHALAEGDATSAMLDMVLVGRGKRAIDLSDDVIGMEARSMIATSRGAERVPSIIKQSVIAPYVDGLLFVHWLRRNSGGWAGVDRTWNNPPETTEQLLHPEKLLALERPWSVPIPIADLKGPQTLMFHDIMGEQSVRLLFEEWMPRHIAVKSAAGWAGDRIAVFRDGSRFSLAWHLRYDDKASASQAAEAFARGIIESGKRQPGTADASKFTEPAAAKKAIKGGTLCQERADVGPFAIVVKGEDLTITAGPYTRAGKRTTGEGNCAQALAWAKAVWTQKATPPKPRPRGVKFDHDDEL